MNNPSASFGKLQRWHTMLEDLNPYKIYFGLMTNELGATNISED